VLPSRPYWKGYLKLALVTCPVALYPAFTSSERVAFRQINKKTGNRLRQQLVDDVTREPVESFDKGRGYEYDKNTFLLVEEEELDAIALQSSHTLEIDTFVPREQIDERYLDSPYYMVPNDDVGQEAFAVIREAMRGKGMVALGRVVLSKRERVIALQPWDKGLLAATLRYAYEVRDAKDYFDDLPDMKVAPDMLKLAEHILNSKKGNFDPTEFADHYEEALVEMLRQKQAGVSLPKGQAKMPSRNVVNLMDALKQSLAVQKKSAPKSKKRIPGQGEMLLPISGKKGKEGAEKPAAKAASRQKRAG
jgi:DNA end-binding protein Ku